MGEVFFMKMLSDIIKVLFESLRLDDEPVNILIDGQLYDISEFYFDENIMEYVLELTDGYPYTEHDDELRFNYFAIAYEVVDGLTGYTYYCPNKELVDLLNKVNKRADRNAKKYWDLKNERE